MTNARALTFIINTNIVFTTNTTTIDFRPTLTAEGVVVGRSDSLLNPRDEAAAVGPRRFADSTADDGAVEKEEEKASGEKAAKADKGKADKAAKKEEERAAKKKKKRKKTEDAG